MVTKNKRGQDLSIGTLILIVLGIIVLVLLILGFTMGWDNLWGKINIFGGTATTADVVTACKLAASSQDIYTFCEKEFKIKEKNADGTAKPSPIKCKNVENLLGGVTAPDCPPPAPPQQTPQQAFDAACQAAGGTSEIVTCPSEKPNLISITMPAGVTAPPNAKCCKA